MIRKNYWNAVWDGVYKIIVSSFFPLLFWTYHFKYATKLENILSVPEQMRPLFLSSILIAMPGAILYPLFKWICQRTVLDAGCISPSKIEMLPNSRESKNLNLSISFKNIAGVSWKIVQIFHLTFVVVPNPKIVLIKCPDHQKSWCYYMNERGELEIDFTDGVEKSDVDTSIDIPIIIQSSNVAGQATLRFKGKGGIFYRLLVHTIIPKIEIKVRNID